MSMGPLRVLIAGSNERMRNPVRAAFAGLPDTVLFGEVASGEQAISASRELAPDVLVLDMEIPGVHAIIVARMILNLQPHLGIVAWIGLDEPADLPDEKTSWMRLMGVCCCVDDEADQAEIEQAILSAARGDKRLSFHLAQRLALSKREHEFMSLMTAGWSNSQIARTFKITPSTVSSHTIRICRKLGITGRDGVVARGRELGMGRDMDETTVLDTYYASYHTKREEFYRALDAARSLK